VVWAAMLAALIWFDQVARFQLAYLLLWVLTAYSITAWLCSEKLAKKRPRDVLLYLPDGTPLTSKGTYRAWILVPVTLMALVASCITWFIRNQQVEAEFASLAGRLYPGNETVDIKCPLTTPNGLFLIFGTNTYFTKEFPHTAIAIDCDDILQIDRESDGSIGVNLTIFDENRNVMVKLNRDHFLVNGNHVFRIDRRHSRSRLYVYDEHDEEVLYVHLANKNVLQMRAMIRDPRLPQPLRLDEHHLFGLPTKGVCVGNSQTDVRFGKCLFK